MKATIEAILFLPFIIAGFVWQGVCVGFGVGRLFYSVLMK